MLERVRRRLPRRERREVLDVLLLQRQPEKAQEVLAYLERSYTALTKVDGAKENGVGDAADAATGAADGKGAPLPVPGDWPKKPARRPPRSACPIDALNGSLAWARPGRCRGLQS